MFTKKEFVLVSKIINNFLATILLNFLLGLLWAVFSLDPNYLSLTICISVSIVGLILNVSNFKNLKDLLSNLVISISIYTAKNILDYIKKSNKESKVKDETHDRTAEASTGLSKSNLFCGEKIL